MDVVRRGSASAVVAGLVLLGGPAWAQEDPCAPGPDGAVPEECQSGPPVSDTGTVGMEPEESCPPLPVEPLDGVVTDEGSTAAEPVEPAEEPAPERETEPAPAPEDEPTRVEPAPGQGAEDGLVCVYSIPVSAPGADGVPESAAGGAAPVLERLPRTGPYDRLLALTAVGSGLLVVGAGAAAVGRRRRTA